MSFNERAPDMSPKSPPDTSTDVKFCYESNGIDLNFWFSQISFDVHKLPTCHENDVQHSIPAYWSISWSNPPRSRHFLKLVSRWLISFAAKSELYLANTLNRLHFNIKAYLLSSACPITLSVFAHQDGTLRLRDLSSPAKSTNPITTIRCALFYWYRIAWWFLWTRLGTTAKTVDLPPRARFCVRLSPQQHICYF